MMNNMNPNQTKVTTTAFAEGEEHVLSAEQAELLFGGGTIFRVQAPGPLKGTWVVVKVNKKSIKISSLVGPDGRPPADQPEDTRATMSFEKWFAEVDVAIPAAFGSAVCNGWPGPEGSRFKLAGPTKAMPAGAFGDKRPLREARLLERERGAEPGDDWLEHEELDFDAFWEDSIHKGATVKPGKPVLQLVDPLEQAQVDLFDLRLGDGQLGDFFIKNVGGGWAHLLGTDYFKVSEGLTVRQMMQLLVGLSMHKAAAQGEAATREEMEALIRQIFVAQTLRRARRTSRRSGRP